MAVELAMRQTCYLTTPQYLRTFRGRFLYSFQARGTIALADDEVVFRCAAGSLCLPFWRVCGAELCRFPWHIQPLGLRYIDLAYSTELGERSVWLTPTYYSTMPVWHTNDVVVDWFACLEDGLAEYRGRSSGSGRT